MCVWKGEVGVHGEREDVHVYMEGWTVHAP